MLRFLQLRALIFMLLSSSFETTLTVAIIFPNESEIFYKW